MGSIANKYRVHEVAKDFGVSTKEITEILTKYAETPKNHMQVLEDRELSLIFEYLTQHNPVSSIAVIFAGYSSYALILIRSSADTPMNQNSPDNVFDLASYLNREQYGDTPLLYGQTFNSEPQKIDNGTQQYQMGGATVMRPQYSTHMEYGKNQYGKAVPGAPAPVAASLDEGQRAENMKLAERGHGYVVKTRTPRAGIQPRARHALPAPVLLRSRPPARLRGMGPLHHRGQAGL